MVAFDNTIFCLALHPKAKPPAGVDRAKDRVDYLMDNLKESGDKIIVPTPAFAEFLILAGVDGPAYVAAIRDNALFRVLPFDEKSAIENADTELAARASGNKRGSAVGSEWQKVKVDRQIIAVAKVNNASRLYSDDPDVIGLGRDFNLPVVSLADLPLPPAVQERLDLVPHNESEKNQPPIEPEPAVIPRSGGGSPEDQTGAEDSKTAQTAKDAKDAAQIEHVIQIDDLPRIITLLQKCQNDTLAVLGAGAAGRLAHWQEHAGDLSGLIRFIQDRIHGDTRENGWRLEQAKKLSLERIVIDHIPHLFAPTDIQTARETLGLSKG
jgi:hypothetical protein